MAYGAAAVSEDLVSDLPVHSIHQLAELDHGTNGSFDRCGKEFDPGLASGLAVLDM